MKKILTSTILLLAALAAGCHRDHNTAGQPAEGNDLTAGFDMPALREATRAPVTEGMISSMWVMVFNENGNYLSRHRGELTPAVEGDLSRYTFRNIPVTAAARTLHFVANHDWAGFADASMSGLSENEVVRSMSVAPGTVAYWQRVVLPAGTLDAEPGTTVPLAETVSLLRNVAQITVANNTASAGNSMSLTDVEFAVGDYPGRGSVAPFNTRTGAFGTGNVSLDIPAADFITEALDATTIDVSPADFVRALNPGDTSSGPVDVFERRNSTATDQTCIIVKGYFQDGLGGPPNTTVPSYYKIDIVDPEATVLLDIRRNHRYRIDLRLVSRAGYPTLEEAVLNAAVNNINAAVTVSEYTAVSDGRNVLRIENSSFIYVRTGEPFEIRYSYIDATSGATNNDDIAVSLVQDTSRPVVETGSFGYTEESTLWTGTRRGARIWGTTAPGLPANDIYRASINISKGMLSRVVQLQLRPAMNFLDVGRTPADGIVANELGQPVSVTFKMPVDISPNLFPIPVYITTKRFSPDASQKQLSVDITGGDYRYVYYAPYLVDESNLPLPHTIHLVSNSPNTEEIITLSADMFNDATVQFGNRLAFTGTSLTPASVPRVADSPVDVGFRIPAGWDWAGAGDLCAVTLFTTSLTPPDGNTTLTPVSDPIHGEGWLYTVAGPVDPNVTITVPMRTIGADNDVSVTLLAPDIDPATLTASRENWNFAASFSSKPRANNNTSTRMTLTFSLPAGSVSAASPVDITFRAPWLALVPDDDANRSSELTGNAITTTGTNAATIMTMRVTTPGPHSFRVVNSSSQGNNEQTIKTLLAPGFNDKTLNNQIGD